MKNITTLVFFICFALNAFGANNNTILWQTANKYYEQKNYDSAVAYYEKIAAQKPNEEVVYFNLGNAYYKLNEIAPAILNYERALHINPGYKDAEDNLSIAQGRITNRIHETQDIFFVNWWQKITAGANAGMWAIISLSLFLFIIGLAILNKLNIIQNKFPIQFYGGFWVVLIACLIFSFVAAGNAVSSHKAVVFKNDTPFYTSPQQTKPSSYIPQGTTLKTGSIMQNWMEVSLPDGRTGWIPANTIVRI